MSLFILLFYPTLFILPCQLFRLSTPAFPYAVEGDDFDRQRRRPYGRLAAAPRFGGGGQHRHTPGFPHRMRRGSDHAPDRSSYTQAFPLPARAADSASRHRVLPLADVFPTSRQLVALNYLTADRFRRVLSLWKAS